MSFNKNKREELNDSINYLLNSFLCKNYDHICYCYQKDIFF